jgi:hypothetical protein
MHCPFSEQLLGQEGSEQSIPVQPTGQTHFGISKFNLSHIPLPEHLLLQDLKEQSEPSKPGSHMHLTSLSQIPLLEQLF